MLLPVARPGQQRGEQMTSTRERHHHRPSTMHPERTLAGSIGGELEAAQIDWRERSGGTSGPSRADLTDLWNAEAPRPSQPLSPGGKPQVTLHGARLRGVRIEDQHMGPAEEWEESTASGVWLH